MAALTDELDTMFNDEFGSVIAGEKCRIAQRPNNELV
ncbi:hypothetical protein SAMN05421858_2994 [Haladaptatus litoreus]|uniref:Uncharacterized protein n=1 Tax=Haladaptatus litoreus TaxID=553468 RepID=A0A1N7CGY7_9EURY|nr:hypothetical protein SAMN05421858_2994 [Haladaptatus litoreus]